MKEPILIQADGFQEAWAKAVKTLSENHWELWDLVVRIESVNNWDAAYNLEYKHFAKSRSLLSPKDVAYTICPFGLTRNRSFSDLREYYMNKFYPKLRNKAHAGWGTYFYRMIAYPSVSVDGNTVIVNQLGDIIAAINRNSGIPRAAYTLNMMIPGRESLKLRGAPCLNSIAIRLEPAGGSRTINLLALYRNHDFLERAYGNYYGLCKLLELIAHETNSQAGALTCVSSHAFVNASKRALKCFIDSHNLAAAND